MTFTSRRKLAAGLMAASLAAASWGANAAGTNPQSLAIIFTGTVVDNTCSTAAIDGGNTVQFNNISRANFTGAGTVGKTMPLSITFSNCGSDTTSAKVYFSGTTDNTVGAVDNKTNAEGETTYATHVGVQMWDESGSTPVQLKSDDTTATTSVDLSGTTKKLTLTAKVVQTGDTTPSLGSLDTSGTLYVLYN